MSYRTQHALIEDACEILQLQKLAYQSEAELYGDFSIPPLTQSLNELTAQFDDHIILKVVEDGTIIGTVRAYQKGDTCYIGRLAVHPDRQNRGIGTVLMTAIERYFNVRRYELFTGARSARNIHLYEKLGYRMTDRSNSCCGGEIEAVVMEKCPE